ncbi:MAG: DUF4190 domain-containing protein [Phycisphaeraceae bacterium]
MDDRFHWPEDTGSLQPSRAATSAASGRHGRADTAFILGIVGMFIPGVGLAAWIMGQSAVGQIDRSEGTLPGRTQAVRAAILGRIGTAIWIVLLLIGLLLPVLGAVRRTASGTQNSPQVRGIVQGCILYAQDNNDWYPGLTNQGEIDGPVDAGTYRTTEDGAHVTNRIARLLNGSFFTPEYAISPSETDPAINQCVPGLVITSNCSYAMLSIANIGARRHEWRATTNSQAAVISDRNIGGALPTQYQSNHTTKRGEWRGSVSWNDNHTEFMTTPIMPITKYDQTTNTNDDLFAATGPDDALMVHDGQ